MKVFTAVAVCLLVAAAQAVDYDNLMPLPIKGAIPRAGGQITGGVEVPPNSLPHQVGLFIEMEGGTAFCGGSLISPNWVLTAAHCAEPGSSFEVVLGAHEIRNEAEPTQVRRVTAHKTVHPEWSRLTLLNDVALLHIEETVELTPAIQPIRLPSRSEAGDSFNGTEALMSGWGKQTDDASAIAEFLQAINKTVIDHDTCARFYFGVLNSDAHICTSGSNGQSTCNGDSGGPLIFREDDGKATQIGIVSFGISFGCEVGWPPVFARVTSYLDFIEETTGIVIRP